MTVLDDRISVCSDDIGIEANVYLLLQCLNGMLDI